MGPNGVEAVVVAECLVQAVEQGHARLGPSAMGAATARLRRTIGCPVWSSRKRIA